MSIPIHLQSGAQVVLRAPGPQGSTGDTGPANSLTVGTVTTGAAGSSAAATISGTPPAQTLSLTIPRGDKGLTGATPNLWVGTVTTGEAAVNIGGTVDDPVIDFILPVAAPGSITPIALAGGWALKSANYTVTNDDHIVAFDQPATATLPTPVGIAGRIFTIWNLSTGTVTVARGSANINGVALNPQITARGWIQIVSDGIGWWVIDGQQDTHPTLVATLGLARHVWNHGASGTTPASYWRLVAYDSGVREIGASALALWDQIDAFQVQRTLADVRILVQMTSTAGGTFSISKFWTAIAGFQPASARRGGSGVYTSGGVFSPAHLWWGTTSALAFGYTGAAPTIAAGATVSVTGIFAAAATLPLSLPGTQVTAPV